MDDLTIEAPSVDDASLEHLRTLTGADVEASKRQGFAGEAATIVSLVGLAVKALPHVFDFIIRLRSAGRVTVVYKGQRIEIENAPREAIEAVLRKQLRD
jgi:hypothetical protein